MELPPKDGDAPLHELDRDALSVFLFISFVGEELTELMTALGISIPGYRLEKLPDVQKADAIADEVRARPAASKAVIELLGELYEVPALDGVALPPSVADEIGELAVQEDAAVRMIWRLVADPSPEVRATAQRALAALAQVYYGPADKTAASSTPHPSAPKATHGAGAPEQRALQKEAKRMREDAERARRKVDELKAQLKDARAQLSDAQKDAGAQRRNAEKMRQQMQKAQNDAQKAKARPQKQALEHAQKEAAELAVKAAALEAREQRLHEERDRLREELEAARKESQEKRPASAPAAADDDDAPIEEVPATWAMPRFSREFYDSIEGWEPRIQRTAFKQAYLLAENHRHPSLRAIALEGVPGYYRIRVATDVRLIYRRDERDVFEILSLIDREDLDRYVRQAKTR